jgi:hypothetical protein
MSVRKKKKKKEVAPNGSVFSSPDIMCERVLKKLQLHSLIFSLSEIYIYIVYICIYILTKLGLYVVRNLFWWFDVFLTVHHDISLFELPTSWTIPLLYNTHITVLYVFWAILCSPSGGQIVLIQYLVSSLSAVLSQPVYWSATCREWRYQMLY